MSETDEKRTTVVYQLFDNVCFQVKKEDGSKTLPEKGHDGRYHVEGKVEIASRDEVKKMVSKAMPLLRAGGQCRKIILTPTARYRDCPCCGTRGHCTNMKERNYKQWMDGRLTEICGVVKDYVRMRNIKRATIISLDQLITPTAGLSEYLQQEELRGEDPVLPRDTVWQRPDWKPLSMRREERRRMRRRELTGSQPRRPSLTYPRRGRSGSRAAYRRL